MIVIDSNLEQLSAQYGICEKSLFDDYSLKVKLGNRYYEILGSSHEKEICYGLYPDPADFYSEEKIISQNLRLLPGARVITCSQHKYSIPNDYFGLVQTKGTLARLFVQATCNDGQVEPGFKGFITLELINMSPWIIDIPVGSDIAQMYIIKCSSATTNPYRGRYAEKAMSGPTLPVFNN